MTRVLITGICGFIAHHLSEHVLKNTDWEIVGLDHLTYAARGFDRLRDIDIYDDKRVKVFTHDIVQPISCGLVDELGQFDYIFHLAAHTHVDSSITNPEPFIQSNVVGTMNMLQYARTQNKLRLFVYFSTDEVFGPAPDGYAYKEWDRYNSTNPYSASKAGGEELALAWANTFKVPVAISHAMNNFGQRQHSEKYIPLVIQKVLTGEKVSIHADSTCTRPGCRTWIHARNTADAILFIVNSPGVIRRSKFNIVGEREVDNLEMAKMIAAIIEKPLSYELVSWHSTRPGHDLRYALADTMLRAEGWKPAVPFEESLERTVRWYVDHPQWLNPHPWTAKVDRKEYAIGY
jgi:dTDP-glucose 4,6-dehydratase